MRVVIIDDEKHSRDSIKKLIELFNIKLHIVGEADSVKSGLEAIIKFQPELILLDIRLPDGTGFDLISKLPKELDYKLIFITAYEEYAIKAFKFNAVDYILKPIDPEDFGNSIDKVVESHSKDNLNQRLQLMLQEMNNPSPKEDKKIIVKNLDAIHIIEVKQIIRCESEKNYTIFTIINEGKLVSSRHMKEYEEILQEFDFYRVHQSHLINLDHVKYFDREKNICVMKDLSEVPISHRKREQLFKMFKSL